MFKKETKKYIIRFRGKQRTDRSLNRDGIGNVFLKGVNINTNLVGIIVRSSHGFYFFVKIVR